MNDSRPDPAEPRASVLDAAIDRAVRRMVQVDPPAGLRRRIEARLTNSSVRRFSNFWRYGSAVTALALLLLAMALQHSGRAPQTVPPSASSEVREHQRVQPAAAPAGDERREASARQVAAGELPRTPPSGGRGRKGHSDVIRMPRIGNVFGAAGSTVAGATVDAPTAAEPGAAPIHISVLTVAPLEIEQIQIPAIAPAERAR
jgi:hypothetical protein